ncbi:hypothetical protein H0H87_009988 [Tephrocybe sp. NHM501043]|nr:hypothetical protein H0H87_009988 [Tephrocybe sp. NHM501043]
MAALFLAVLAGKFTELITAAFIVCFAFLQFFFNFGANTYRATAHGISAAAGKAGAIVSALAFNTLSKKIGTPAVLWSERSVILLPFLPLTHLPAQSSLVAALPALVSILPGIHRPKHALTCTYVAFTLLLPEVKGRDPDLILAEEIREARAKAASQKS